MKPLIGITTNYVKDSQIGLVAHIGGEGQYWQALADDYIQAIVAAGGIPVIIPVLSNEKDAKEYLNELDGILFAGGCDISPLHYGKRMDTTVGEICNERDNQELLLMRKALAIDGFPVFGICRGCQLLNVALGGSLIMDIDTKESDEHFFPNQRMSVLTHTINTVPGSLIDNLLDGENRVNSYHHQCVDKPGVGVVITATDSHGIPECIEVPKRVGFTLGTQWHPEGLACVNNHHLNLFNAFVQAALERKKSK